MANRRTLGSLRDFSCRMISEIWVLKKLCTVFSGNITWIMNGINCYFIFCYACTAGML